jgi:hypothetical protein
MSRRPISSERYEVTARWLCVLVSSLNSHGPVVNPGHQQPLREIWLPREQGRLSDGGTGCSFIHFLPLTARGRNSKPSSAMNVMKASQVFLTSAVFTLAQFRSSR